MSLVKESSKAAKETAAMHALRGAAAGATLGHAMRKLEDSTWRALPGLRRKSVKNEYNKQRRKGESRISAAAKASPEAGGAAVLGALGAGHGYLSQKLKERQEDRKVKK